MTMVRGGAPLGVQGAVDGDVTDIQRRTGYGVRTEITVEGTPGEKVVLDGIWDSIKEAGDLPVWASATLTWAGREWPWTNVVSKFNIQYQAVHMAEGSILATVVAMILYALPYVASILLVLLGWKVVTYMILKIEDVSRWMDEHGPAVGVGVGAGAVLLLGLMMMGDDKK